MLSLAAARLGLKTHVFAPEERNPAYDVASARTIAPYTDEKALKAFAEAVDVAGSDDIIALSVGTHQSDDVSVDAPLAVVGACTEGSIVSRNGFG